MKRSLWKKICVIFSPSKLLASTNRNITYNRDLYLSRFVTSDSDLFSDDHQASSRLTSTELAVSLIILKARYHLSHQCINDVLRLFRDCQIDVPSSYKSMKRLFRKHSTNALQKPTIKYICPSCASSSKSASICSSCASAIVPRALSAFFNFDLASQIQQIISSSPNLFLPNRGRTNPSYLCDIVDGTFYDHLFLAEQANRFITLTMNVDGVSPNRGSDLSIWPVFLVNNEIEKSKRFVR
jgi:hypothetical protein